MMIKKYISAIALMLSFSQSFGQAKLDSLQILKDVNGGGVVFTTVPSTEVATLSFGNGFGVNNMAFIASLRAYTNTVLPITLSSFKPVKETNSIKLIWTTSSESNSDYFEILKSVDGSKFNVVGLVKAAGNSNQILTYSFNDINPVKGNNYYQLKMVDFDRAFEKSIIVSSSFDFEKEDFFLQMNTESGILSLNILSDKAKIALFEVFDLGGRKLFTKNLTLQNGVNNFDFSLNTNSKVIIVNLTSEGNRKVKKLIN
ncbi:hypothetical protein [Pedobacter glucosidilyticus]|uniref:hypothetical protein n=1 Tax=Pedobacter glucosidilyticus TaxID=1122941 RepID=UPI0026EF8B9A|nr:hypothetical protein [Pedobacter glucosidilyticus]